MNSRLLTKTEAAAYLKLKPTQFSNWIREGRISPPIPGTHRWDIRALDRDLDKLSGLAAKPKTSALDEWREKRDARRAQRAS